MILYHHDFGLMPLRCLLGTKNECALGFASQLCCTYCCWRLFLIYGFIHCDEKTEYSCLRFASMTFLDLFSNFSRCSWINFGHFNICITQKLDKINTSFLEHLFISPRTLSMKYLFIKVNGCKHLNIELISLVVIISTWLFSSSLQLAFLPNECFSIHNKVMGVSEACQMLRLSLFEPVTILSVTISFTFVAKLMVVKYQELVTIRTSVICIVLFPLWFEMFWGSGHSANFEEGVWGFAQL